MYEKRMLHVNCPSCAALLQVKTRSAEKTVVCPKCQASVLVSATPADDLLSAQRDDSPARSAIEENSVVTHRCSPRQLAIAAGIFASVFLAGIVFAVAVPGGGPQSAPLNAAALTIEPHNPALSSVAPLQTATNQPAAEAAQFPEGTEAAAAENTNLSSPTGNSTAAQPDTSHPGASFADSLEKFKNGGSGLNLGGGFNQGGNSFPQGGLPNLNTTPRDQQRNWDLQNAGRLGAMGLKKVQVPRR